MKRMHDDKFINELNATASEALENANNAQSDIDRLASVYTFAKLEISESDFDDINPYGTPEPVTLAVGDTIYENGQAVLLTAGKLEELYAANIVILSSGQDPTNHDTITMQRQSADPLDDGSDGSARFESFTVARGFFYHWTMNVNRVDSGSGEGGGITIACNQTSKPIYIHPITISNLSDANYNCRLSLMIFNNSSIAFTKSSLISYLRSIPQARMLVTGSYRGNLTTTPFYLSPAYIYFASSLTPTPKIALVGIDNLGVSHTSANNLIDVEALLSSVDTEIYDGVNRIN